MRLVQGPRAYLIGLPGAGKTSLLRSITAGLASMTGTKPFAHVVYVDPDGDMVGCELGARHEIYGGTDRLSMSVQPAAIEFVKTWGDAWPTAAIVGEGDRLATRGFLDALGGQLVWLDTPMDVTEARRAMRPTQASATWVAGRATKISNLLAARPHVRLDGTLPPGELRSAALAQVAAFRVLADAGVPV